MFPISDLLVSFFQDVENVLKSSFQGQLLLGYQKVHGELKDSVRNSLCDLLVGDYLHKFGYSRYGFLYSSISSHLHGMEIVPSQSKFK